MSEHLTKSQEDALCALVRRGNSPWGWSATDLGVSGRALNSLWERGLVTGGRMGRAYSYRYTSEGEAVAKAIEAQRAETNEDSVPSSDESAVGNADLPK